MPWAEEKRFTTTPARTAGSNGSTSLKQTSRGNDEWTLGHLFFLIGHQLSLFMDFSPSKKAP